MSQRVASHHRDFGLDSGLTETPGNLTAAEPAHRKVSFRANRRPETMSTGNGFNSWMQRRDKKALWCNQDST